MPRILSITLRSTAEQSDDVKLEVKTIVISPCVECAIADTESNLINGKYNSISLGRKQLATRESSQPGVNSPRVQQ